MVGVGGMPLHSCTPDRARPGRPTPLSRQMPTHAPIAPIATNPRPSRANCHQPTPLSRQLLPIPLSRQTPAHAPVAPLSLPQMLAKPYLRNIVVSPHIYPPSISKQTDPNVVFAPGLYNRLDVE